MLNWLQRLPLIWKKVKDESLNKLRKSHNSKRFSRKQKKLGLSGLRVSFVLAPLVDIALAVAAFGLGFLFDHPQTPLKLCLSTSASFSYSASYSAATRIYCRPAQELWLRTSFLSWLVKPRAPSLIRSLAWVINRPLTTSLITERGVTHSAMRRWVLGWM